QIEPEIAFKRIGELVCRLAALRPEGRILGVGMAMPGPFDVEAMSFVGPTTLEAWKGAAVEDRLSQTVPYPLFIGGDTAAAAEAERLYGVGGAFRSFYYLYFGVGLGGRLVSDGGVVRGA